MSLQMPKIPLNTKLYVVPNKVDISIGPLILRDPQIP